MIKRVGAAGWRPAVRQAASLPPRRETNSRELVNRFSLLAR